VKVISGPGKCQRHGGDCLCTRASASPLWRGWVSALPQPERDLVQTDLVSR